MSDAQAQKKPKDKKVMVATIASTVLWVLSIALAFIIKAGSAFAFVPDVLLLLGFFPLLILWKRAWLTFLFGLFNAFIGFFLLLLQFLPDEKFTGTMQLMRNHLLTMHSCWSWTLIGLVALIWGGLGMIADIFRWVLKKRSEKRQSRQELD